MRLREGERYFDLEPTCQICSTLVTEDPVTVSLYMIFFVRTRDEKERERAVPERETQTLPVQVHFPHEAKILYVDGTVLVLMMRWKTRKDPFCFVCSSFRFRFLFGVLFWREKKVRETEKDAAFIFVDDVCVVL